MWKHLWRDSRKKDSEALIDIYSYGTSDYEESPEPNPRATKSGYIHITPMDSQFGEKLSYLQKWRLALKRDKLVKRL